MDPMENSEVEKKLQKLKKISPLILSLTLSQLQTLTLIKGKKSPLKAAKFLRRQQTSVSNQLTDLNKIIVNLCGEELAIQRKKGEDYAITQTGEEIGAFCEDFLLSFVEKLAKRRRTIGKNVHIATTIFALPLLANIWERAQDEMSKSHSDFSLKVHQVKTKELAGQLEKVNVDVVIAGATREKNYDKEALPDPKITFQELKRDEFCLLTNLKRHEHRAEFIDKLDLKKYHIILPDAGVMVDAIERWYGSGLRG